MNYYKNKSEENDIYNLINESDLFLDLAKEDLSIGDIDSAATYVLQWLKLFSENFSESDFIYDSQGLNFKFACTEAANILKEAFSHPVSDITFKQKIVSKLINIDKSTTVFSDYGFFDMHTFTLRINALSLNPKDALNNIERIIKEAENLSNIDLGNLIIDKYDILISLNMDKEAMQTIELNLDNVIVCNYILDTLIKNKDYDISLNILDKAIEMGDGFHIYKWLLKKIEIYELLDMKQKVIDTYRKLFIVSNGEIEYYESLKARIPENEWKLFLSKLLNETSFSDYCFCEENNKAEIFIYENDYQSLYHYLLGVDKHNRANLYDSYAKLLREDMQSEIIPLYVESIYYLAQKASKRSMYSAVKYHIKKLQELNNSIQAVTELVSELLVLYRRRPTFIAELKEIEL